MASHSPFVVASITGDTLMAEDPCSVQQFNPGDRIAFHCAGQRRHVDLYGGDFVVVQEANWDNGTIRLLSGQASCVVALTRGDVAVKWDEPKAPIVGFFGRYSKPMDLDRLEALRLWCKANYVRRVVIDGIELELSPEAFYVPDGSPEVVRATSQTSTIGQPLSLHERIRREAAKESKE